MRLSDAVGLPKGGMAAIVVAEDEALVPPDAEALRQYP